MNRSIGNGAIAISLDFGKLKNAASAGFQDHLGGKKYTWTSWSYFNNGAWAVIRLAKLE